MRNPRSAIPTLLAVCCAAAVCWPAAVCQAAPGGDFSMSQVLDYPDAAELAAAEHADVIAWVRTLGGVRNIWIARGPEFRAVRITNYREDDGQEITQLTFSPDGSRLVFVRGGDHDANWPAEGNLAPDPASSTQQPQVALWAASLSGGEPVKIADGDAPAISSRGELAYTREDHVWTAPLDGGKAERLFFDRGKDSDLQWSPDGSRLAFVSKRGDHSFIGVYSSKSAPIAYLEPSTNLDSSPRWSADGTRLAFVRQPGDGGPPEPILTQVPHPWSIWVSPSNGGAAHRVWQSPDSLSGSYPDVAGEANLHWAAGDRLVFLAYLDDWPHLYSVPAAGGAALLLTPGAYMVEHVAMSPDRRFVIYDANTGNAAGDDDRRHIFRVPVDRPGSVALSSGESVDWTPVGASDSRVAYIAAGARQPPIGHARRCRRQAPRRARYRTLAGRLSSRASLRAQARRLPIRGRHRRARPVVRRRRPIGGPKTRGDIRAWRASAADAARLALHGLLLQRVCGESISGGARLRGPVGQLSAGHRLRPRLPTARSRGTMRAPPNIRMCVAGARYLQTLPNVDAARLGIWGGSYGGYLTGLALARNSDLFKAGVDLHGVHDWSRLLDAWVGSKTGRYEKGDREQAMKVAWESSPDAAVDGWRSPVLLIQGDDDRNVPFDQTVDLARRLETRHIPFEELVIPNEIHGFLRHASWSRADEATADFLRRRLAQGDH